MGVPGIKPALPDSAPSGVSVNRFRGAVDGKETSLAAV